MNKKTTKTKAKRTTVAQKATLESNNNEILKLVKNELGAILGYNESPDGLKLLRGRIVTINLKLDDYEEYSNKLTFSIVAPGEVGIGELEMDFDELYEAIEKDAIKLL